MVAVWVPESDKLDGPVIARARNPDHLGDGVGVAGLKPQFECLVGPMRLLPETISG